LFKKVGLKVNWAKFAKVTNKLQAQHTHTNVGPLLERFGFLLHSKKIVGHNGGDIIIYNAPKLGVFKKFVESFLDQLHHVNLPY